MIEHPQRTHKQVCVCVCAVQAHTHSQVQIILSHNVLRTNTIHCRLVVFSGTTQTVRSGALARPLALWWITAPREDNDTGIYRTAWPDVTSEAGFKSITESESSTGRPSAHEKHTRISTTMRKVTGQRSVDSSFVTWDLSNAYFLYWLMLITSQ